MTIALARAAHSTTPKPSKLKRMGATRNKIIALIASVLLVLTLVAFLLSDVRQQDIQYINENIELLTTMQEIVKDTTRTSLVRDTSLRLAINEFDEVLQGFTTVDEANNLVADLSALKRLNEETREKINALHQKLKKRHSIIRDESE
jgi:hypothetical protein